MTQMLCPFCKSDRTSKSSDRPEDHTYRCKVCSAWFEPDDEGYCYSRDPTMRLEREEERARERRERLKLRQQKPR